jgi:protein arginine kinase activator
MLCEICKKNEAIFHVTKIVNGNKEEISLCQKCAKEFDGFNIASEVGIISPFSFQNILSGLMGYIGEGHKESADDITCCKNCGISLREFKENGLLGCDECYKNFSTTVNTVIGRVQGKIEHVGKIPKKSGKNIIEKKRMNNLKQDLQKSIALEEYEEAAVLRDKIREINSEGGKE